MRTKHVALAFAVLIIGGCKKSGSSSATGGPGGGGDTPSAAPTVAPLHAIGMVDPFAHLTGDGVKSLNVGYAALKGKHFDDAQAAFAKVTAALPDYTIGWYQEVRAAALGGHFNQVAGLWTELMARDYVAYVGRLDKARDMKPLRESPEWAKVQDVEAKYKTAYADGLVGSKGFFFVARAHEPDKAKPGKEAGALTLELRQEAYYYDLGTSRYRRLTETGGHVYAIHRSPDGKVLAFFTTTGLDAGSGDRPFSNAKGGAIDLTTLETTGPFPVDGRQPEISFLDAHEPLWLAQGAAKQSCFDTARTAIIDCPSVPKDARDKNGVTTFDMNSVTQSSANAVNDVKIDSTGTAITVTGYDQPLRVARPITPASLDWSPGKKRLSYSGSLDGCDAIKQGKAAKKNELFVFDADKKTVARIANAVATFETLWLDDDHLVYEGGVGKGGRLHLYDFTTKSDTALAPRAGAGLYGYPVMLCEPGEADAEGEADAPPDPPTGDAN